MDGKFGAWSAGPFSVLANSIPAGVSPVDSTETTPPPRNQGNLRTTGQLGKMSLLGEVGEFGLNHIPAKNAACESGPEGSNPSLSAIDTERTALGVGVLRGEAHALLD